MADISLQQDNLDIITDEINFNVAERFDGGTLQEASGQ
jgi:hypothetical protein